MSATRGTDGDLLEEASRGCAKCVAVRRPEFHLLREPRPMTECVPCSHKSRHLSGGAAAWRQ